MCLGRTHCLSGAVLGAAWAEYVAHLSATGTIEIAGLTAGAAVLLDLDHPKATLAQSFGFLTKAFAWTVGRISGGHRHGTHSILGVAVFTGLSWLGVHYRHDLAGRIGLCLLLTLVIAGGLYAARVKGHVADLLAIGGAVAMAVTGTGLALVCLAVTLGCVAHLMGDMATDSGVPLLWPVRQYRFKWWPEPFAYTTGTGPETAAAFVLLLALGWLAYHAITLTLHLI